jgi:hypothetical protein
MTEARVEKVYEDHMGARVFLAQAEIFLGDADTLCMRRLLNLSSLPADSSAREARAGQTGSPSGSSLSLRSSPPL